MRHILTCKMRMTYRNSYKNRCIEALHNHVLLQFIFFLFFLFYNLQVKTAIQQRKKTILILSSMQKHWIVSLYVSSSWEKCNDKINLFLALDKKLILLSSSHPWRFKVLKRCLKVTST